MEESYSDSSYSEDNEEDRLNRIENLKKQMEANPKDENNYKQLIDIYRKEGDIDEGRSIRVQYKRNCSLSPGTSM